MNIQEFIEYSGQYKEIAQRILSHMFGINKGQLFLRRFEEIPRDIRQGADSALERARRGEPLEYIFGEAEFFGRTFLIDEGVLIPRPETELLVEAILDRAGSKARVLDLCTGSGIIGLSLKAEREDFTVLMTDISDSAISCAKKNREKLGLDAEIIKSDLFENVPGTFDIIVSNPPYIKRDYINDLDISVKDYEPILALDGGPDGLYFYKEIVKSAGKFLNKNGMIGLEIGYDQGDCLKEISRSHAYEFELLKDYSKNDRMVFLRRKYAD